MTQPIPSEVVFDLTSHPGFPPHGENRSELIVRETVATLTVFFDATGEQGEASVSFRFSGVSQAVSAACPGVGSPALGAVAGSMTGLARAKRSDLASEWTAYWQAQLPRRARARRPAVHHFQIFLTEANWKYDIFAEDVEVQWENA